MTMCYEIVCPPTGDECTPGIFFSFLFFFYYFLNFKFNFILLDPTVGGEVVITDIACDVPSIPNPYEAACRVEYSIALIIISIIVITLSSIVW